MGLFNRQTGDFCRCVHGGSRPALVFIYTWYIIVFLLLFIFILFNLLLFNLIYINLRLQNVYNLSTKFSTLKYRSENRSRKAGVTTCLKYLTIWILCAMILTVSQRRWSLRWFRYRFWRARVEKIMFFVKQQLCFVFQCGWMPEDLPANSGRIKD